MGLFFSLRGLGGLALAGAGSGDGGASADTARRRVWSRCAVCVRLVSRCSGLGASGLGVCAPSRLVALCHLRASGRSVLGSKPESLLRNGSGLALARHRAQPPAAVPARPAAWCSTQSPSAPKPCAPSRPAARSRPSAPSRSVLVSADAPPSPEPALEPPEPSPQAPAGREPRAQSLSPSPAPKSTVV